MRYIYSREYYSAIKKNEIMPFIATQIDLEFIIWSKSEEQISYDIGLCMNLCKWYKWIYLQNRKRLIDLREQTHGEGRDRLRVWDWHVYTDIFKTDNEQGILYSTGNSAQYPIIT